MYRFIYEYVCMYISINIYTHMNICIYIYVYVCMHIRMYIYICMYICIHDYSRHTQHASRCCCTHVECDLQDRPISINSHLHNDNKHTRVRATHTNTENDTLRNTSVCTAHTKTHIHATHMITCVFVHSKHKHVRVSRAFHSPWLSLSLSLVISFSFALSLSFSHARGVISPPMPRASTICSLSCCRSLTHAQTHLLTHAHVHEGAYALRRERAREGREGEFVTGVPITNSPSLSPSRCCALSHTRTHARTRWGLRASHKISRAFCCAAHERCQTTHAQ